MLQLDATGRNLRENPPLQSESERGNFTSPSEVIMHAIEILSGRNSLFGMFAVVLLLAACGGGGANNGSGSGGTPDSGVGLRLERIDAAFVLNAPLFLTSPPGDTARLFVVEKGGRIKVVDKSTSSLIGIFLDISSLVSTGSEQGLLGMAFDPQYATNGRFYVSYTDKTGIGNSVVARYLVSPNPNVAMSTADRIILTVTQPATNHNGGMIAFGPDNFLYLGFGDGGGAGDPDNRAQNRGDLLGKLLRIDVSQSTSPQPAYLIPPDNPYVGQSGVRTEIWSFGLRNPWRYSFDRQTGDLYIADVGQGNWEEVDVATSAGGTGKGANFGWKVMEGGHCYPPGSSCNTAGLTFPLIEYDHSVGCSIAGGYVYRGTALPALQGTYFYADYCQGFVRSFRLVNGVPSQLTDWTSAFAPGGNITSFGEDGVGDLYVMTTQQDRLYRIVQN